ncbi:hypothetical protein SEA_DEXERS_2 [Streptomyces phage Dexers]|nr:hypothetical protein SEA_DEXERS_2 [Streptomyces phage Dexers]
MKTYLVGVGLSAPLSEDAKTYLYLQRTETAPESIASSSLPFGKDIVGGTYFHVGRCA